MNIAERLRDQHNFERVEESSPSWEIYRHGSVHLAYFEGESILLRELPPLSDIEGVVFASKHRSLSGEPTLTVHVPGNFTPTAQYGGRAEELARAWPQRMGTALRALWEGRERLSTPYKVSLETTHHGPTQLQTPVWYVEIGSSEAFWVDGGAGGVVAEAIWASITEPSMGRSAVGFGGGHYAPKHTSLTLEGEVAVGHILSKMDFDAARDPMLLSAFERTVGGCDLAVVDWKGLRGGQRERLLKFIREFGVETLEV